MSHPVVPLQLIGTDRIGREKPIFLVFRAQLEVGVPTGVQ